MQALFGIYQRVHTRANHIGMYGKLMNGSSRRDQRRCPSGKTVQEQTNRKPKGLVPQNQQRDEQNQNHNSRECKDCNSQDVWACIKKKKKEDKQLNGGC